MSRARRRLDQVLVHDGTAPDLEVARTMIAKGCVLVEGAPALNAARAVRHDESVSIVRAPRFVGRGGEKLEAALVRFEIDVRGERALDVGASTGGFTDCLLQRGASKVLAVDVGRDQLHEHLEADARVIAMERTNVLDLRADVVDALLGGLPQIATVDVSFTSLAQLVGHVLALCAPDVHLVALVKPQFEATRADASKGRGVVRDVSVWRSTVGRCASAIERSGAGIIGVMASPLKGAAGNVEFLLAASRGHPGTSGAALDEWIESALSAASALP
jgi:23S rRNA (cytidine1920-2'-O)/16S rRNA (cytidine1409-2'-O)-methyltransferase